jgi:CRISPR-associated protein Cas1
MKGGAFLETCVRDIKTLLLEEDGGTTEFGPDAFNADVVMLWDDNGRRVAAGTSYGSSEEGFVEFDQSYTEISEWLTEDS